MSLLVGQKLWTDGPTDIAAYRLSFDETKNRAMFNYRSHRGSRSDNLPEKMSIPELFGGSDRFWVKLNNRLKALFPSGVLAPPAAAAICAAASAAANVSAMLTPT